ncbi:fungal-specific transcription factor domain-containing protein [Aspergillus heterothallicus]
MARETQSLPSALADNDASTPHPSSKRRRIDRACDDCRRLKIKCDGLVPCRHCSTYERACTFNVPLRRPKALSRHIQDLEDRLHAVERLLEAVNPGLYIDQLRTERAHGNSGNSQRAEPTSHGDKSPALEARDAPTGSPIGALPILMTNRQQEPRANSTIFLPKREVTNELLTHALQDACILHRFVHEPTFHATIAYIYKTPVERLLKDHPSALALFYAALTLGDHFANGLGTKAVESPADTGSGNSRSCQPFYFNWALNFLSLDVCQDFVSLQALCFLAIYLQSSGQPGLCYSYTGIALRSAVALGLHRRPKNVVNHVEIEMRKRVFWVIWRMDVYSSSVMGIPPMLSADLVDQEFPEPIDDTCEGGNNTKQPSGERELLLAAANAHTRLTLIMPRVMRLAKVLKRNASPAGNLQALIEKSCMVEVEQQLQAWFRELPLELLAGDRVTPQVDRSAFFNYLSNILAVSPLTLAVPDNFCASRPVTYK